MLAKLSDLSLRTRLLAAFGLLSGLLVLVGAIGFLGSQSQSTSSEARTRLEHVVRQVDLIRYYDADVSGWQVAVALDVHNAAGKPVTARDPNRVAEMVDKAALAKLLPRFPVAQLHPAERRLFRAIVADWGWFWRLDSQLFADYTKGTAASIAAGDALTNGASTNAFTALSNATLSLSNDVQADSARKADALQATGSTVRTLIIAATLVALLIALGAAVIVIRSIVGPSRQLAERLHGLDRDDLEALHAGLRAIAAGDLSRELAPSTEPIPDPRADEIGQAARSANGVIAKVRASLADYDAARGSLAEMTEGLKTTAHLLATTSGQLATSSAEAGRANHEITRAIDEVAQGAARQAGEVEQTRRSVGEVAMGIRQSSQTAGRLADVAERTRALAGDGVGAAAQASDSMQSVRDSASAVTDGIQRLAAQAERVSTITQTIHELSEQTNLLALNAAIEAARAGEQGRGFAVVAEEVRKLADGSREAAEQIGKLIATMQQETTGVVALVQQAAERSDAGVEVVEQTRAAFVEIDGAVNEIAERIREVAATAESAAGESAAMQQSIDAVSALAEASSAATEQVSASTQETTATAEQIAASAHELADTAQRLNEMAARFRSAAD